MPVEIRELIIKVTVEENERKNIPSEREMEELKTKIVKECLEKVVAQLENLPQR